MSSYFLEKDYTVAIAYPFVNPAIAIVANVVGRVNSQGCDCGLVGVSLHEPLPVRPVLAVAVPVGEQPGNFDSVVNTAFRLPL